jgi:hypothetical protein
MRSSALDSKTVAARVRSMTLYSWPRTLSLDDSDMSSSTITARSRTLRL